MQCNAKIIMMSIKYAMMKSEKYLKKSYLKLFKKFSYK